ncbi:hypothetical protein C2E23DRAFT_884122 [Lenzites betulinus]|nr:hypothetical protein C2E23DRAFT_884122 [Lenzites betulinus]
MPYGYFPTPARSEPGHRVGGLCTDFSLDFEHRLAVARLRRTHSVPTTPAAPNTFNWERQPRVGLGLDLGLPTTLVTHFHPRPERPRLRRQADQLGLGVPFAVRPTRSMRRHVAGAYSNGPTATAPPTRRPHNAGRILRVPASAGEPAHHQYMDRNVDESENEQPHPAITLTLADAFDSESDSDDAPLYAFLPQGSRRSPHGTPPAARSPPITT